MIKKILKQYREKEEEYTKLLKEAYAFYVRNVSNEGMAASLRSCVFLGCMMEVMNPKRVLDLGSGISSYSLRFFKQHFKYTPEIYSVDSDWAWLEKSREFSAVRGVDSNHFYHWSEIKDKNLPFEIIFMDIDRTRPRLKYYDPVAKQFTTKGSLMLVDDMHKPLLRRKVLKMSNTYTLHKVTKQTKHKDRYDWLLEFTGE